MPHVHLSLQSGADMVLKRMKRRHTRAQALDLVAALRARRPDIAIGADLIAGFPTEDDAHHADTLAIVREARRPWPCLSLFAAPRHARRAHAAGRPGPRARTRRTPRSRRARTRAGSPRWSAPRKCLPNATAAAMAHTLRPIACPRHGAGHPRHADTHGIEEGMLA
jgi:threonylcarbamoyladenosine tRNA methylthiotransferase MtaB